MGLGATDQRLEVCPALRDTCDSLVPELCYIKKLAPLRVLKWVALTLELLHHAGGREHMDVGLKRRVSKASPQHNSEWKISNMKARGFYNTRNFNINMNIRISKNSNIYIYIYILFFGPGDLNCGGR